ncbi:IS1182 family transposase [Metalysinibacillus jejuensis]|uniref:IS1182 family transposase n=1 Tax=Metalysinibacillus jejuensis TaxID=914327 RepID=UPI000D3401DC|nr:IS1182 family transposase [Metalysinibacillus jejuensis]
MFKNYTMNQLILPLDIEMKLQANDIAFHVHNLVESIPYEAFAPFLRNEGCPAYHPRMMLKIILCAYTQSVFSGRKIEALLKDSLRMMWLAQGYEPSYRTINRFRVHKDMKELLRQCFVQFRCQLVETKQIDNEAIFIDGTKIEANANKFTFVWKKAIVRYQTNLIEKSQAVYDELLDQSIIPAIQRENEEELTLPELVQVIEAVDEVVKDFDQQIEASTDASERKHLRRQRKHPKAMRKTLIDLALRKQKYAKDMTIFGTRNSYAKTDQDATFMRMKDDYMRNGQLKAGYNVQIATEGQYALAYQIFPNPTDTLTLRPFLDEIEANYFTLPEHIVADAGYGSEQNYDDILTNRKREALITYNLYLREQKKKYQQNPFNTANWPYDETTDSYTCPNQQTLAFHHSSVRTDRNGFTRTFKVYQCENCTGCPFRASCTKAKEGNHRTLVVNEKWENQKKYVKAKLSAEKTGAIYRKRKIDVEPVFGHLKANLRFTRFSVRGKAKVANEMGLALMAVNLRKFTANQ